MDTITLKDLIKDKISELGEKATEYFGISAGMIAQWSKDIKPPTLGAAEKVFAEYQARQALNNPVTPIAPAPKVKPNMGLTALELPPVHVAPVSDLSDAIILMPIGRGFAPNIHTWETVERLKKRHGINVLYDQGNPVIRARNNLAFKFMDGGWKKALWVDDDMLLQCGDARHFNHYREMCGLKPAAPNIAGLDTLEQLWSHRAPIVTGLYYGRGYNHPALVAEAQENHQVSEESRKWTGLKQTKWCGFGCMLTHISAFERILEACPEIRKEGTLRNPHQFFTPDLSIQESGGEDVAFCFRATRAKISIIVDSSVRPGHIGSNIFCAENTNG